MMASAYLEAPGARLSARTRAIVTPLFAIAFYVSLAVHRPHVRYWIDPCDRKRQIVVAIAPRRFVVVPVLRLLIGTALLAAVVLVLPALTPAPVLGLVVLVLVVLTAVPVALGLLTGMVLLALPYPSRIRRAGPSVPGTQITASMAASTVRGGMRDVRAYLAAHHGGQRLTVRARDERARTVYQSLGLEVVAPGCGRMTGIIH